MPQEFDIVAEELGFLWAAVQVCGAKPVEYLADVSLMGVERVGKDNNVVEVDNTEVVE
jgi:hypothetical protein